ncbi:MAG: hypothetical protein EPO55_01305 [Reyranella sp.]|uniref:hypothetical protein n=1 Tax=Reyranella sp. TaxID=1929291 RepID=UPI00121EE05F|nr:hypothetical protein [Reyranella sp.]TAJ42588.1 MAG: hypothetical protein EPO55_01305 [Reyranella sp.]
MTDPKSDAETMYGPDEAQNPSPGTARIELWYWPIGYHGHTFLRFIEADGKVQELHGYPESRNPGSKPSSDDRPDRSIADGSKLSVVHDSFGPSGKTKYDDSRHIATVASGPSDRISEIWQRGMGARNAINDDKRTFDYKVADPSYFLGSNGGQIQNSNSAIYTLGQAMKLDLDGPIRKAGIMRKFPGWGRDLFDPTYDRYLASPPFPVKDAR